MFASAIRRALTHGFLPLAPAPLPLPRAGRQVRTLLVRNGGAVAVTALLSFPQTPAFRLQAPREDAPRPASNPAANPASNPAAPAQAQPPPARLSAPPLPPGYILSLPPRSVARIRVELAAPEGLLTGRVSE